MLRRSPAHEFFHLAQNVVYICSCNLAREIHLLHNSRTTAALIISIRDSYIFSIPHSMWCIVCCCSYCVKLSEENEDCKLLAFTLSHRVRVCRRSNLSLSCHLSTYSMNWKLHVEVNWRRRTDEDCGAIMQHILSTSL